MLAVLKRAVIRDQVGLLDAHQPEQMVKTRAVYSGKTRPSLRRPTVSQGDKACLTEKTSIALMRIGWALRALS